MNTRSKLRSGKLEPERGEDGPKFDSLIRPPLRRSNKAKREDLEDGNKTETSFTDKLMSDHGDRLKIKTSFSGNMKRSPGNSRRKMNVYKMSNRAPVHEDNREEHPNHSSSHSGSESDNEDESNEEKLEYTLDSNIYISPSKAPDKTHLSCSDDDSQIEESRTNKRHVISRSTDDCNQEERCSARQRKEFKSDALNIKPGRPNISYEMKEEFVYKQELRKANEKMPLLDTRKYKTYSDDEEELPKPQPVKGYFWILVFIGFTLLLGSALVYIILLKKPSTNKAEQQLQVMQAFQDRFRKLPMIFSGQSLDLWQRSQRVLELQLLRGHENKEPAIILLTAAQDAEQMLYCIGNQLTKTFASTLNSSYTVLSGLDMTSETSEDVKMDIDQRLSAAFQANNRAAVLHRLELLPPGSLTILYKYCDHENAAFKNVALVLTVLLKNSSLQRDIELKELEEKVHDFLKEIFINQAKSKMSHNEMDGDKLGGVWSRISHVVLPVFPEKQCERMW